MASINRARVVVADDHLRSRRSSVRALRKDGDRVVAEGAEGTTALTLIRRHRPDVALLDVRMPRLDGIDVVAALAIRGPDVPVVMLSAFGDEPLMRAVLDAGAAAYVTKDADRELILRAVRAAASPSRAPRALAGGARNLLSTPGHAWIPRLTVLEHRLLVLAHAGLGTLDMAERTSLGEDEIRCALDSAIDKLGAATLPEALGVAGQAGML
jgi:DNA-binding NarL/FixJ family response regulator